MEPLKSIFQCIIEADRRKPVGPIVYLKEYREWQEERQVLSKQAEHVISSMKRNGPQRAV